MKRIRKMLSVFLIIVMVVSSIPIIVNSKDRTILSRHLAGWGEAYDAYFD